MKAKEDKFSGQKQFIQYTSGMFDTALFLGFPLSEPYQRELFRISSVECDLFIQNQESPYLQRLENEGNIYLGKFLGASIEMAALDSSHSHIYSLLKKLVPDFPYEQQSLVLVAITIKE